MNLLNKDELYYLLAKLELSDLFNFSETCKKFYQLCKNDNFWIYKLNQLGECDLCLDKSLKVTYILNILKLKLDYRYHIDILYSKKQLYISKPVIFLEINLLENLKHLILYKNPEIYSSICNLTNLETLQLSRNNIKIIPKEISKLINLKNLKLNHNSITEMSNICVLTNLKMLNLFHNKIKEIPDEIDNLKSLECLLLGNNPITKISFNFEKLNLTDLHIDDDKIDLVPLKFKTKIEIYPPPLEYGEE